MGHEFDREDVMRMAGIDSSGQGKLGRGLFGKVRVDVYYSIIRTGCKKTARSSPTEMKV
jgi:hypothetical protein